MARKKKPTGLKKLQYHYGVFWQKPSVKLLHLLVFVAVFAWLGHYLFFAKAAVPYFGGADQIVAQYQSLAGIKASRLADGTLQNAIAPGDVLVAGDGTLYCNTAIDGVVTSGKLGPGELKQLFDTVNGADVRSLAGSQKLALDANTNYDTLASITINATDRAQVIYNQNDTTGTFARTAAKLQQKCKNNPGSQKVSSFPNFKNVNLPVKDGSQPLGWVDRALGMGQAGATSVSDTDRITDANRINYHRASSEDKLPYYSYRSCLQSVAAAWAYHMGITQSLAHNPNFANQIASKCGKWYAVAENVGQGPTEAGAFAAFLNSCAHHSNFDDRKVTTKDGTCGSHGGLREFGVGVYVDSKGTRWIVQDFAWY